MILITPVDVDQAFHHFVTSIQTQPVPFMVPDGAEATVEAVTS